MMIRLGDGQTKPNKILYTTLLLSRVICIAMHSSYDSYSKYS
jgi:hypothetical protein